MYFQHRDMLLYFSGISVAALHAADVLPITTKNNYCILHTWSDIVYAKSYSHKIQSVFTKKLSYYIFGKTMRSYNNFYDISHFRSHGKTIFY